MKVKLFIALMLMSTSLYAQKGIEDLSRFGHGEDSIKCLQNISIYTEYVNTNNFVEAYAPWKEVFNDAPVAQAGTYTNGIKIVKYFISKENDPVKKAAYAEELMSVYDQQIKYLDYLNKLVKTPMSEGAIKGKKAYDYIAFMPTVDIKKAYNMLYEAVQMEKGNTEYYIIQQFMKTSAQLYKSDNTHGDQLIQDYLDASAYIVDVMDKYNAKLQQYMERGDTVRSASYEKMIDATRNAKENIDGYFINSGAAECDDLQAIYAPKIEENKDDIEYLRKVIAVMGMLKCTEQEAYLAASEYAHNINPTPESALGCGYRYYKRGEYDKAMEYFDEAIELEESSTTKAEYCYKIGLIQYSLKQYVKARNYAQKAISINSRYGAPYILIAQCYAASPKWSDKDIMNKCTYFAAIDKLQRAKAVDSSVADEANKLITSYKTYTPPIEELFFLGSDYTEGKELKIGGWINETTTIRKY